MKKRQITEIVRRNIRLPKRQFDFDIIRELEHFGLIEKINKKRGYLISQKKYVVTDLLD